MKQWITVIIVGVVFMVSLCSVVTHAAPQDGEYYYLRHEFSGHYVCSGEIENGGSLWLWGPIPDGHEARYKFKLIAIGGGYYYLRHEFSGKYVCSGELENGGKLWLWGPIPDGQEARYKFKLTVAE